MDEGQAGRPMGETGDGEGAGLLWCVRWKYVLYVCEGLKGGEGYTGFWLR